MSATDISGNGQPPGRGGTATTEHAENMDGIAPHVFHRRWRILGAMCVSLLTVMLANGSLTLALPGMSADLGLTTLQQTWAMHLYALTFAALLFTCGSVGDRYGRKILMQAGLAGFTVASVYAGFFADSGGEVIFARGLMGIAAALVMPTTLSVINNVFPRRERARAIAIWTGVAGAGAGLGSVLSGVLLEHYSWHSVFVFSAVLGLAAFVANQLLAPESRDEHETPVDWLGGLLTTIGILGVVYAITEGPSHGISDPLVLTGLIAGVVGLGLFLWWQTKVKHPMLDLTLFKNPVFSISTIACLIAFFALIGSMYAISQLFQLVLGYGTLKAAVLSLPMMIPMMLLAPLVPVIVKAWGARWTITAGLALMAAGFFLASFWDAGVSYWAVMLPMIVIALGMSLAMPPATELVMGSVPRNRSGMGSAMNDTSRELGGAIGIAVLGALLSSGYSDGIADTVRALPAQLGEVADSSLAGALQGVFPALQQSAGGEAANSFLHVARSAWMDGLSTALVVSAAISLVAALVSGALMPGKKKLGRYVVSHETPATATDGTVAPADEAEKVPSA